MDAVEILKRAMAEQLESMVREAIKAPSDPIRDLFLRTKMFEDAKRWWDNVQKGGDWGDDPVFYFAVGSNPVHYYPMRPSINGRE